MSNEYQGFNIPEKIIIVKKEIFTWKDGNRISSGEYQGYVVPVGNDKMLETALNWADCKYEYKDGKYEYIDKDKYIKEYDNGNFELKLANAATDSYQSGKLSFWDCIITAKDRSSYLIGINSDLLFSLLVNSTFVNGVCQSKVYLGRQKGRVGAFTEDMDEFIQSKKDAELRNRKMSTNYGVGQRVFTKTSQHVYLGEMYKLFDVKIDYYRDYNDTLRKKAIIFKKPKKVHVYGCYKYEYKPVNIRKGTIVYDLNELIDINLEDKKVNKYFNEGETFDVKDNYEEYCKVIDNQLARYTKRYTRDKREDYETEEYFNREKMRLNHLLQECIEENKCNKAMYASKESDVLANREKLCEVLRSLNYTVVFEEDMRLRK